MGLAQAGVSKDKQGVIALPRIVGHLPGGGVGELVGGAHYKAVEGILLRPRKEYPLLGRLLESALLVLRQDGHLKVGGEQLVKGVLDRGEIAGGDDIPLEAGGRVEHKAALLQGHRLSVVKPGIQGGRGHFSSHQSLHFFPYFRSGIHKSPPHGDKTSKRAKRYFHSILLYQKIG